MHYGSAASSQVVMYVHRPLMSLSNYAMLENDALKPAHIHTDLHNINEILHQYNSKVHGMHHAIKNAT